MKILPISVLCEMKSRQKKSIHRPKRAYGQKIILAVPANEPHTLRKSMLRRAERLIRDKNYPRNTIVKELARLFVSKIIAERN